ncbi:hypothetical protein ES703_77726 [subsurface metagenome]
MKRIGFIDGRRVAGWHFTATATPGNGQVVDVHDPSAGATGSISAQTLKYRSIGTKTGAAYYVARTIEVHPGGDLDSVSGILEGLNITFASPGAGALNLGRWWALDIFVNDVMGHTVHEIHGLAIGMFYDNPTTLPHSAFIRCQTHGAVPMPAFARITGSGVTNLFYFQRCVHPVLNAPVGVGQTKKIRVTFGDVGDFFIPLYTS